MKITDILVKLGESLLIHHQVFIALKIRVPHEIAWSKSDTKIYSN